MPGRPETMERKIPWSNRDLSRDQLRDRVAVRSPTLFFRNEPLLIAAPSVALVQAKGAHGQQDTVDDPPTAAVIKRCEISSAWLIHCADASKER